MALVSPILFPVPHPPLYRYKCALFHHPCVYADRSTLRTLFLVPLPAHTVSIPLLTAPFSTLSAVLHLHLGDCYCGNRNYATSSTVSRVANEYSRYGKVKYQKGTGAIVHKHGTIDTYGPG
jgi:hypothetical protein